MVVSVLGLYKLQAVSVTGPLHIPNITCDITGQVLVGKGLKLLNLLIKILPMDKTIDSPMADHKEYRPPTHYRKIKR